MTKRRNNAFNVDSEKRCFALLFCAPVNATVMRN